MHRLVKVRCGVQDGQSSVGEYDDADDGWHYFHNLLKHCAVSSCEQHIVHLLAMVIWIGRYLGDYGSIVEGVSSVACVPRWQNVASSQDYGCNVDEFAHKGGGLGDCLVRCLLCCA